MRIRVIAAVLGLALPRPVTPASGPQGSPLRAEIVSRPEAELLLLAVRLRPLTLTDTMAAYASRGGVLVPLGQLCALLELGIQVDVASGRAGGFILDERRLFQLDARAGQVIVEGRPVSVAAAEVEVHADDLYVDTRALSRWLPVDLDVDLYAATLTVRAREPLPVQMRDARAAKSQRSLAGLGLGRPVYPRLAVPYRFLDVPFVDQTLGLTLEPRAAGGRRQHVHYSTHATGDLLGMGARFYLSGDEGGLTAARLTLERRDPDGGLLGPLGARDLELGEVLDPGLDLVTLPKAGSGVLVGNFPLHRPEQFDREHFRGELPPGWEVELARNNALIGFAQSRPDGLYEFLDVPLLFGLNLFRLVFFGPQGQRREETRIFNVGDALSPPGTLHYRFVASDPGLRLVTREASVEEPRWLFDGNLGLLRSLTASVSVAGVELSDGRHEYGKAGLRSYWGRFFTTADVVADRRGGRAVQAAVQTRLGPMGLLARHADLRDFRSERFQPGTTPLRSRTELRIDAAIPRSFLPRIAIVTELGRESFASGRSARRISSTLSTYEGGYAVSNRLGWTSSQSRGTAPTSDLTGQLLVSRFLRRFSLRGQVDYALKPSTELDRLALTVEARLFRSFVVSSGVNRQFPAGQTRIVFGVGKSSGPIGIAVNLVHEQSGGLGASLLLSMGFSRDPRSRDWQTSARTVAGSAAISAGVFLDRNANGHREAGEPPVPGAGFLLNGVGGLVRTDDEGNAFIPGVATHRPVGLALATSTLEDVAWKPGREGVSLVPRPGRVIRIDLPVVVLGEVTGTVYVRRSGESREMGGVQLELVGGAGEVLRSTRTAYDGYYDFMEVRPGRYEVRVSPDQAVRLGLAAPPRRPVEIAPDGTVVDGLDLVLEPGARAAVPAEHAGVASDRGPRPPHLLPAPEAAPAPAPELALERAGPAPAYAVQLASHASREKAEGDALRLGPRLDQPVHVFAADLGLGTGTWFRLLVGEFASADEADSYRIELKRCMGVGPVYRLESGTAHPERP